ncbi:DsrE family protein [Candidatus Margulisiibacteriota bacterium]
MEQSDYNKTHLFLITGGSDGFHQACFALQLALTFMGAGVEVIIYLSSDAAKWAHKETNRDQKLCGGQSLDFYLNELLTYGAKILVCGTCVMENCNIQDAHEMQNNLLEGIECAGISKIAELSLKSKVFNF